MFSRDELQRYARHFSLPEIGEKGQEKLKAARVLCIGVGGLGCPLLLYLAAAGVGSIGIVDKDKVEISNLQRQILFDHNQIGFNKSIAAREKLIQQNPYISIQTYPFELLEHNALEIISKYDFIADCTDNFYSRYLINDACFHLKKPNVSASISGFEGYLSIFSAFEKACCRCLFPYTPSPEATLNCSELGVLGIVPGLFGILQANEMIKLILNIGKPLINHLLMINTLSLKIENLEITKNNNCPLCSHQKTFFTVERPVVQSISVFQLKNLKDTNQVLLIDVREPHEHQLDNLGGLLIPLNELAQRVHEIKSDKNIVFYCKSGHRSQKAVQILSELGLKNIKFLSGGMVAWKNEI